MAILDGKQRLIMIALAAAALSAAACGGNGNGTDDQPTDGPPPTLPAAGNTAGTVLIADVDR